MFCVCMFLGLLNSVWCTCFVIVFHSDDSMYVGSLCSSVGLGICVIEHLSIESSVVDGSNHIVSREGVATDPEKTNKVSSWPIPI